MQTEGIKIDKHFPNTHSDACQHKLHMFVNVAAREKSRIKWSVTL